MNWKHLIWIIPLIFIIGTGIGYKIGMESIELLNNMVTKIDNCCMSSLDYAINQNPDCKILIIGKMNECYKNETENVTSHN